ncbi:MAG: hypothetical protein P1Q69_18065 [Candidatus Thorarchaeota archaeon]|nr:hypothetical protein [Candidatus Thorarchaeota archaeon]
MDCGLKIWIDTNTSKVSIPFTVSSILEVREKMAETTEYKINSYGIFLQRELKDFKHLLPHKVHVSAIIGCHPSDTTDFKKAYFIFIEGKDIPDFKYPDHIRDNDSGEKCAYIFRSSQYYKDYVDLLRNEKPIVLWWIPDKDKWQLATGQAEPVGEGSEKKSYP